MQQTETTYENFASAYRRCCRTDNDFDGRFFHVLIENPYDGYIFEAKQKIEDKSLNISPEYRKDLLAFLDALEGLGNDEYTRTEGIDKFHFADPDSPDETLEASKFQTFHDINGWPLSDEQMREKTVSTGADLLFWAQNALEKTDTLPDDQTFPKEFCALIEKTFKRKTVSSKALQTLIDQTSEQSKSIHNFFVWEFTAKKMYKTCFALQHFKPAVRSDIIGEIKQRAQEKADEAAQDRVERAHQLQERKAKFPEFIGTLAENSLKYLSDEQVENLSSALKKYNIHTPEELLQLYHDVHPLMYHVPMDAVQNFISHTEKQPLDAAIAQAEAQKSPSTQKNTAHYKDKENR